MRGRYKTSRRIAPQAKEVFMTNHKTTMGVIVGNAAESLERIAGKGAVSDVAAHAARDGVVEIPDLQSLLHYICENGFEHRVAANLSRSAAAVHEASTRYMGWDMYWHRAAA
jgi:hypothetical protein